ncbi:MAG: hypothetical protein ACTTKH_04825 [Treponema sp.]
MKKYILMLSFIFLLVNCKRSVQNNLSSIDDGKKNETVKLVFNDKIISCNKGIAPEDLVQDGTEVTFTFIGKLEKGEDIKAWKENGEKIKDSRHVKSLSLKIDAKKTKKVALIEVELEKKEDTSFVIQFDEEKINANGIHGNNVIAKGYKAKEGEQIKFSLKDKNLKLKSWRVNGNEVKDSEKNTFLYTVKKEDANNEGILVDYIEKEESYTLKFVKEKISAYKMPNNEEITSPYQVKVGETYKFSLKDAKEKLEYWTCNNNKIEESAKNELLYTVKKTDVGHDLSIEIGYKILDENKVVITFGDDIEKCVIPGGFLSSDTEIKNGQSVAVGSKLKITAKLIAGEEIEKWFIGLKEEAKKDKVLYYTTRLEDAKDGVINIRIEKKTLDGAIIKYDASLINCINYESSKKIEPNSQVFQGMKLKFTAKLKAGFELLNWAINGEVKTTERRESFIYAVELKDAKGQDKEIEVSYNLKESETYKIIFDEKRIACHEDEVKENKVKKGDAVHEGVWLKFEALLDGDDEVEHWLVKGVDAGLSSKYSYQVNKNDVEIVNGEKVINVGVKLKQKCKFQFDDALISCKYAKDHKAINKEIGVTPGWSIVILAKLKEGEKVSSWKIDDVVQKEGGQNITTEVLRYKVRKEDANSEGVIKIDVEIEKLKSSKIKFDEKRIVCKKGNTPIQSESVVWQGDELLFKPIKARGEIFENWKINNTTSSTVEYKYIVDSNDEQGGYINVDYKARPLTPFFLKFEEPVEKCNIIYGEDLASGSIVYEGEKLKFTTSVKGEEIEDWLVKGKAKNWADYTYFHYTVATQDIETIDSKLTFRVSCKLKEKIRIVFESSDMTCKFYYQYHGGAILPNDIILPKKWIRFNAILPKGKKVKRWRLNGNEVHDDTSWLGSGTMNLKEENTIFDYLPSIEKTVLANDGKREIKITIEFE